MDHKTSTLIDQAIKALSNQLESGSTEEFDRFLKTMAQFHQYSWGNVFLILAQRPDATLVAGFRAWKRLGRWVMKGERGIAINVPLVFRKEDEDPDVIFKVGHVFDVSQTDGQPLPDINQASGDPGVMLHRLHDLILARQISLVHVPNLSGAHGVSEGGRIKVLSGLAPATEFSVLVHELAHELLHRGKDRPRSRKQRELEAEAVAYVVCSGVGIDSRLATADYIRLYGGDNELLVQSLGRIQPVARQILDGLVPTRFGEAHEAVEDRRDRYQMRLI